MKDFSRFLFFFMILSVATCYTLDREDGEERKRLGERKFRDVVKKSDENPCWKEAVSELNSTCKKLTDGQQSRLAVAFANCHLGKSGRQTYACDSTMSVKSCTQDMDAVAFQTYTEFFTHTGHICYFLQSQLWQERAENTIFQLSETSSETVFKLQRSLEHHKAIEVKQNKVLGAFETMEELALKQRDLLWEVYSSLKGSIEGIRYIMSLFLIELVGIETFIIAVVMWVLIYFLPQFGYSRFWLNLLLIGEQAVEIVLRRFYGKAMNELPHPSPDRVNTLYSWIWVCRYTALCLGLGLYIWQWLVHSNPVHRNLLMLQEIQQDISRLNKRVSGALLETCVDAAAKMKVGRGRKKYGSLLGSYSKAFSRYSEPPLSPCTKWRLENYMQSLPGNHGQPFAFSSREHDLSCISEDESLPGSSVWNRSYNSERSQSTMPRASSPPRKRYQPSTSTPKKRPRTATPQNGVSYRPKRPSTPSSRRISFADIGREKEVSVEKKDAPKKERGGRTDPVPALTEYLDIYRRLRSSKENSGSKRAQDQDTQAGSKRRGPRRSDPGGVGRGGPLPPPKNTSLQLLMNDLPNNYLPSSHGYNLRHTPRYSLRARTATPTPEPAGNETDMELVRNLLALHESETEQ